MKVIDPGHLYQLNVLDVEQNWWVGFDCLQFVKRVGLKFPGNTTAYPGTTLQEVLRACCNRLRYVAAQGERLGQPEIEYSNKALSCLREAIRHLEVRAAKRHGRSFAMTLDEAEFGVPCKKCNHVGCEETCH